MALASGRPDAQAQGSRDYNPSMWPQLSIPIERSSGGQRMEPNVLGQERTSGDAMRVSGSSETKTYGKSAMEREHEE